ncbi:uncharacterized protein PITG_06181 [Phytophthora infestans T30-4]|uniref:Fe2OG dioxygenase domain-containing protein n=1 Tax=Phytophthora infestans (strain T30-4) TaxID=403677 RepID=D0N498_PHYIT|nr:uncharacterized protein PITG_06181 [Phytophthora infestans T30-4]EEY69706.1 conserved hypothetical protein [Phytophthora infestans T30-4]|eukprot:XP_002998353.1 conserved hypothetical protein [Phytophthora infestans T30-4]
MAFKQDFNDGKWPFGGEGGSNDVPTPAGAACVKISKILASADEHAGEYSFGGVADALPVMPGLFINGVGFIPLPLAPEHAEKLIAKCAKSPFGHNLDTKMDDSVRKSWQLQPDQLELRNPLWQGGIEKLTETIAARLGYKGVPLNCVLYKLLVYGEGGHFLKHQDTEKEDGMIATLVVQPPSTHEGGDLVVYRNGQVEHRHDFGKIDGTAAYLPHYAVHYSDAEHALEDVTKGYRLALVYSICLPSSLQSLKRDPNVTMSAELANAFKEMGPEDGSFALLLSHEYTKKSIGELGSGALKGIDSARFRVLEEANESVPADKKLRFLIVKIAIQVDNQLDEEGWMRYGYEQALHWYLTSGTDLGHWKNEILSKKLNFLNPSHETLLQFWKAFGNTEDVYTGNEGPIKSTKYGRFAIIAWPAVRHLENVANLMSAELAVEELASRRPVDATALHNLLDTTTTKYGWGEVSTWRRVPKASVRFCRTFCELLVDSNDLELTKLFLTNFCPKLGFLTGNSTLIPVMIKLARVFAWDDVGVLLLNVLGNRTNEYNYFADPGESDMEVLLHVAGGIDDGIAKLSLIEAAIAKDDYFLSSVEAVDVLWSVVRSGDKQSFDLIISKIQKRDPRELGPFVEVFSRHLTDYDESTAQRGVLQGIADKRMQWLKREIERLEKIDKEFSWRMPYAEDPDYPSFEDFLRGPDRFWIMKGVPTWDGDVQEFTGPREVKKYAKRCLFEGQYESSYTAEAKAGETLFVTITKTRKWFEDSQVKLAQYQTELSRLSTIY